MPMATNAIGIAFGSASVSGVVSIGRVILGFEQPRAAQRGGAQDLVPRAKDGESDTQQALPPKWASHAVAHGQRADYGKIKSSAYIHQ